MRTNRILVAGLFAVTFLIATAFSAPTVMARTVQVFLDGTMLNYTDVQPQIINDRAMVPLRETATHFGMEADWNEATSTMIFTGSGRTMIHTIHTNTINVNGQVITFTEPGMSSMIANDRTLMPLRMLAEAIGHDVHWDDAGFVDIWTDGPAGNANQPPAQQPPAQAQPPAAQPVGNITIFSADVGRLNHNYGEPILILVATNNAADRVRVTDFAGTELAVQTTFTYDTQGRYFEVHITPDEYGEQTVRVFGGNANGFATSSRNIQLNVIAPTPEHTISITNLRLSGTGTDRNRFAIADEIAGTVRTSPDVVRVRIEDSVGRQSDVTNRYMTSTPTFRTWEFSFRSLGRNGTFTYYVVAFDADGNYESIPFQIIVGTGTDTGTGTTGTHDTSLNLNVNLYNVVSVLLYNRDGSNTDVRVGDRVRFTITTGNEIDEVEIMHVDSTLLLDSTRAFTTSGSQRIWTLEFVAPNYDTPDYYLRIFDIWHHRDQVRLASFNVR